MFSQIQQIQNLHSFPQNLFVLRSPPATWWLNSEIQKQSKRFPSYFRPQPTLRHTHTVTKSCASCVTSTCWVWPILSTVMPLYPFGWASLLLCFAPKVPPCLQACFSIYFLQDDHLQLQTGHLPCLKLENLPQASGIRFKLISLAHLMSPLWQASAFASSFISSTFPDVIHSSQNGLLHLLNYQPVGMSFLFLLANDYSFFQSIHQWQLLHLALTDPCPF